MFLPFTAFTWHDRTWRTSGPSAKPADNDTRLSVKTSIAKFARRPGRVAFNPQLSASRISRIAVGERRVPAEPSRDQRVEYATGHHRTTSCDQFAKLNYANFVRPHALMSLRVSTAVRTSRVSVSIVFDVRTETWRFALSRWNVFSRLTCAKIISESCLFCGV